MSSTDLTAADLAQLAERGITPEEARRQLSLLAEPPPPLRLDRPCRLGDGILSLDTATEEALLAEWEEAAAQARLTKLVPASGAATRMFRALRWVLERPEVSTLAGLEGLEAPEAKEAAETLRRLPELPFFGALAEHLDLSTEEAAGGIRKGNLRPMISAILDRPGLGYGVLPKALIGFHRSGSGARTAFEEHLVESLGYLGEPGSSCRVEFTVGEEHLATFAKALAAARERLRARTDLPLEVSFSTQDPATDTLALDASGQPFRDQEGRLLFRPAGHGALLKNLQELGGDLVVIKNIDNVQPEARQPVVIHWKRVLIGLLATLEERARAHLEALADSSGGAEEALAFLEESFALRCPEARRSSPRALLDWVLDRLRRPLRVCGVVPNVGEPGGGPFWVRAAKGAATGQIVESAQVDRENADQASIWAASTHFNPVDLVCAIRRSDGAVHDLHHWVDQSTSFVAEKSHEGRKLRALERPGLWNGAMAGWNTAFVEVPGATFAPVKTVRDLLRPEHQA